MKNNIDAKSIMMLHSEAKIEFYKSYLKRYLRILYLAPFIDRINIFDVFCGTGIYENDKKGSPIVAFDTIQHLRNEFPQDKAIGLIVNDGNKAKVSSVKDYIDNKNENYCFVEYHNRSAEEMFEYVISTINDQSKKTRNLIFIDPYGYKEIKKAKLQKMLENKRTEIILFLPISQMQRFTTKAVESDLKPYEPLKEFVYSFFDGDHPIKEQTVKALDYITFIKDALKFGDYFSTSYFIERDNVNYYGLFFVSPNIYGFEKILEVKWELDKENGRGFRLPQKQVELFGFIDSEQTKNDNYSRLEDILKKELQESRDNREIYEVILRNEFLPTHGNEIFENWQKQFNNFEVIDCGTKKKARKGSFYISWNSYKDGRPRVIFTLRQ